MENFKVIIVEDVPLELKGTEGLLRNEVPDRIFRRRNRRESRYTRSGASQFRSCSTLLQILLNAQIICRAQYDSYANEGDDPITWSTARR